MGSYYFFGGWMFGLVWIGILSALRDPDEIWQSRARRACFVLGVVVMLGVTAVIVAASNGPRPSANPSRESIWVYCLGCAVPVTLLAFGFFRSALVRPVLGAVGTLLASRTGSCWRGIPRIRPAARRSRCDGPPPPRPRDRSPSRPARDHHARLPAAAKNSTRRVLGSPGPLTLGRPKAALGNVQERPLSEKVLRASGLLDARQVLWIG